VSFDLQIGEIVPLESLRPHLSTNGDATAAVKPEGLDAPAAGTVPPQPVAPRERDPEARPDAADEPIPGPSGIRPPTPAPHLRPNRLLWRGRLASDPEVRRSRAGIDYCAARVLQNVLDSQRQPVTQGIETVVFRERAHDFARVFRKGDLIEIMGELRIREWQDRNGGKRTSVSLHPSEEIALVSRPQRSQVDGS